MIYLSVVDIKHQRLEYIQTGFLFPVAIMCMLSDLLCSMINGQENYLFYDVIDPIIAALFMFGFMVLFSLRKNNGNNSFGGADIWVIAILGLVLGFEGSLVSLLISCISFVIFIGLLKIIKKERKQKIPFVPFIFIGMTVVLLFEWL